MNTPTVSPVRQLYAKLCDILPPNEIDENLQTLDDYRHMQGDSEIRFREWVYERMEKRALVDGLYRTVLRPADARKLAARAGCPSPPAFEDPQIILQKALARLGVFEPGIPPPIIDGIDSLRGACDWLDRSLSGSPDGSLAAETFLGPDGACRRAAERMVKVLAVFLWKTALPKAIWDVARQGLYGFQRPGGLAKRDMEEWLMKKADLGSFNYLLRAVSRHVREGAMPLPVLREATEIWGEPAFQRVNAVADALKHTSHDTLLIDLERRNKLHRALTNLLKMIDEGDSIRLPRTIQFFRRYEDGHALHHEGYDHKECLVRCFECPKKYHLHIPYLFLGPTNPSVVEIVCTELPPEFTNPV